MVGKIVQYDPVSGKGVIILENGNKREFMIEEWRDFGILPEYGLKVKLEDEKIVPVRDNNLSKNSKMELIKNQNELRRPLNELENVSRKQKIKSEFIQKKIQEGWQLQYDSQDNFTMIKEEKKVKILSLFLYIIIGLIFGNIVAVVNIGLGIIVFIIVLVMGFITSTSSERDTLTGKVAAQTSNFVIYENGVKKGILTESGELSVVSSEENINDMFPIIEKSNSSGEKVFIVYKKYANTWNDLKNYIEDYISNNRYIRKDKNNLKEIWEKERNYIDILILNDMNIVKTNDETLQKLISSKFEPQIFIQESN